MKIHKTAKAGTLESNDIFIIVEPIEGYKIEIDLESIVLAQFEIGRASCRERV